MSAPVRLIHPANTSSTPDRGGRVEWLSVRVELVAGRPVGALWPPPGRYLLANPLHTFAELADAIDTVFARWDLHTSPSGRLRTFDLAAGWHIRDPAHSHAVDPAVTVETTTALGDMLSAGEEFIYTFDLNDGCWRHECRVTAVDMDP
ncbi:MAG: hypothetical protein ACRD0P_35835, partial [Stackebrandtia sp.]